MHQTNPTSRDPHGERSSPVVARSLRAIFGAAVLASILTVTTGCDKNAETAEVVHRTSLANKPNIVFLLFGDHSDPRVLPVATTIEGQVAPVSLDAYASSTTATSAPAHCCRCTAMVGPAARGRSGAACGTSRVPSTSFRAAIR